MMNTLRGLRAEVNRTRDYPNDADGITPVTNNGDNLEFSVRYLGDWQVPDDEEDDGDYDWKEPTPTTRRRLDALVKRYPGTTWQNDGEKCWLTFRCKA